MKRNLHSSSPHPAALAAESDLVNLTREFESLRSQLANNDEQIEDLNCSTDSCFRNYEEIKNTNSSKIAHLKRQRRVLEAQHNNVIELMQLAAH